MAGLLIRFFGQFLGLVYNLRERERPTKQLHFSFNMWVLKQVSNIFFDPVFFTLFFISFEKSVLIVIY